MKKYQKIKNNKPFGQNSNKEFYQESIKKYGISAQGVHWNSQYSQYERFKVLTSFIKDDIDDSTIIDAGCGFGEYYNYLFDNNHKIKRYIGIDCEVDMINIASKRFLNTEFYVLNILEDNLQTSDYYICSGAMNILKEDEVFNFIKKCFEASKKGFIFNFLKNDSLTTVSINNIIQYINTLTTNIHIKDNYLENDISIYLEK